LRWYGKKTLQPLHQDFLRQRGMRLWIKAPPGSSCGTKKAPTINAKIQSGVLDSADDSKPSELADSVDPYGMLEASVDMAANTFVPCVHLHALWQRHHFVT
jgi:hypothetical protein